MSAKRRAIKYAVAMVVTVASGFYCAFIAGSQAIAAAENEKLFPGESRSSTIGPHESDEYTISATRGELLVVEVVQSDIDLSCELSRAPEIQPLLVIDSQARAGSVESISFVANADGEYRVKISSKYRKPESARYSIRFVSRSAAGPNDRNRSEIDHLLTRALLARKRGEPRRAAELGEQALTQARLHSTSAEDVAKIKAAAAMFAYWNGEVKKFIEVSNEAWAELKGLPADDPHRTIALENAAFAARLAGDIDSSENLTQVLLDLRTAALGSDHALIAPILGEMAALKRAKSDFNATLDLARRSLTIRENWYGLEHLEVVQSLQNLAGLSYALGDDEGFIKYSERALAIRRKNLPLKHPDIARSLMDLGNIRIDLAEYDASESMLTEALSIRESAFGKDHPLTSQTRSSLGSLNFQRGRIDMAKKYFDEVWRLLPSIESGMSRTQTAYLLQGLGSFYGSLGDFERAEPALRRNLEERIRIHGQEGLEVGRAYDELARVYAQKRQISQALSFQLQANSIAESHLTRILNTGSEQQKLNLMSNFGSGLSQTISLHADNAPDNAQAAVAAVEAILNRKGRILDALLEKQESLNADSNGRGELKKKLEQINSTLSREVLSRDAAARSVEWRSRIEQLISSRREIFAKLADQSVNSGDDRAQLRDVQARLDPGTALIEFKIYRPYGDGVRFAPEELIAYVVRRDGPPAFAKLGRMSEIEADIKDFRRVLSDPSTDAARVTKSLSSKIVAPLLALVKDAERLVVSPDGLVTLVPLQALTDLAGRHLVERFSISYVTSGRDLLRKPAADVLDSPVTVFADPAFGVPVESTSGTVTRLTDHFQPLRATRGEAELITKIFPEARNFLGIEADETAFKSISRPAVLHIATHGFFLEDDPLAGNAPEQRQRDSFWKPEFQLFRSGLVFSGVNLKPAKGDDGVLTALEASALDLRGTKLVVLSACDTGVGSIKNGEGVYGLRRAFAIAGAEAVVMSLWQVSDQVTRDLMQGFYRNLHNGAGRADALRMVQQELSRQPSRKHPYYWASFIHAGAWTPIRRNDQASR